MIESLPDRPLNQKEIEKLLTYSSDEPQGFIVQSIRQIIPNTAEVPKSEYRDKSKEEIYHTYGMAMCDSLIYFGENSLFLIAFSDKNNNWQKVLVQSAQNVDIDVVREKAESFLKEHSEGNLVHERLSEMRIDK
jgi:hypothetical protein